MKTYLALLRGVNVGGHNILPMAELRACFTEAGFQRVRTYINSGNVLFTSEEEDILLLTARCQKALHSRFGWPAGLALLTASTLQADLAAAPAWWGDDPNAKHNAIFVIPPATPQEIAAQVGEAKNAYERVKLGQAIIFWSADKATFSRTSWLKLNSIAAYQQVTVRNAATARKLAELAK